MANQVGEQMGQIVAQGIADVSENSHETDAKAEEIYQGMKKNSDEIITDWKVPSLLISLPVKPLIKPVKIQAPRLRLCWVIGRFGTQKPFGPFYMSVHLKVLSVQSFDFFAFIVIFATFFS
jgi:hypothetical protein